MKSKARFIYASLMAAFCGVLQMFSLMHFDGLTIFFSAAMIVEYLKLKEKE